MAAKLVATFGDPPGDEHPLDPATTCLIGRGAECDIVIRDDTRVSRRHAALKTNDDGHWVLADLKSRNGTHVNRQPIVLQRLHGGDLIRIGRATFEFRQ